MTIAKHRFTGIPVAIASGYIKLLERSYRRWQLFKLHRLIYESLYPLGMPLGFCYRRRIQNAPRERLHHSTFFVLSTMTVNAP